MIRRMTLLFILLVCGGILISGCTTDTGTTTPTPTATTPAGTPTPTTTPAPAGETIADIVGGDARFETLAAALEAANLTETLDGQGPYTLFAPTDEAFEDLPNGMVDVLLADPGGDLRSVLLYHVVPEEVRAAELANLTAIETIEGSNLTVNTSGEQVTVDGALVIVPDMQAENGIIHVIDAVMVPPSVDIPVDVTQTTPTSMPTVTPTTGRAGSGGGY